MTVSDRKKRTQELQGKTCSAPEPWHLIWHFLKCTEAKCYLAWHVLLKQVRVWRAKACLECMGAFWDSHPLTKTTVQLCGIKLTTHSWSSGGLREVTCDYMLSKKGKPSCCSLHTVTGLRGWLGTHSCVVQSEFCSCEGAFFFSLRGPFRSRTLAETLKTNLK